ncbi:MAG: FAD-dependent oxidoreductase, partial [Clostridia bacterium]|nr:FAD-dependent oxidoreductase [Clostridia bacterium]
MKRYLLNENLNNLPKIKTDVLIVGSGIAGLYAAFNLDTSMKVMVVTKASIEKSNSWLAQGGIASVIAPDDVFESHIEDTLKAGAGLCDLDAVTTLVEEGPSDIRALRELSVPFDRNEDGELLITREGGHSCRRIVHCGGDATGRETTRRLGEIALARKNIDCLFDTYLVDILTDEDGVCGAIISDGEPKVVICSNVILATGGSGFLYTTTTNPEGAVGDGIAAAERAGAEIFGMELVQFHPTTLATDNWVSKRAFLISEAVRGEGCILRNSKGEAFMQGKHPLADLAPRDIVTREIIKEMNRTGEDKMFLDVSSMSPEFFERRFPTIYSECQKRGVDVPSAWIPIRPSQHYLMGG